MKATKIAAFLVIVLMCSVCVAAPSSDAATKTYTETKYVHDGVFSGTTTFHGDDLVQANGPIDVYTETEYEKWHGPTGTGTYTSYNSGTSVHENGKCGVVSMVSVVTVVAGTSASVLTLTRDNMICYSFTGLMDATTKVHVDFGTHFGDAKVLVVRSSAAATAKTSGIDYVKDNSDYKSYVMYAQTYAEGTNSADFSFKCSNTDIYWVLVEYSGGQQVTCGMTVNGAADFTDSNALSIGLILIAVATLGVLLFISNKKLIK